MLDEDLFERLDVATTERLPLREQRVEVVSRDLPKLDVLLEGLVVAASRPHSKLAEGFGEGQRLGDRHARLGFGISRA
ncbi:MAG TPA: hypothetical protein VER75_09120 [Thermoleophilaceae bacterium]|nr:hypothetical protein [Thermoleophilaceae bacterium]